MESMAPNIVNQEQIERQDLSRVAISLVSVFLAYIVFSKVEGDYVARHVSVGPNRAVDRLLELPFTPFFLAGLFVLVELSLVILVCWNVAPIGARQKVSKTHTALSGNILSGAAVGVGGFVLAMPFLTGPRANIYFGTLAGGNATVLRLTCVFLLFVIALPLAAETVFRKIVQQQLGTCMSGFAAVLVSFVLFVSIYPIYNAMFVTILGIGSGVLYSWRRSLLASVISSSLMSLCLGIFLVLRLRQS